MSDEPVPPEQVITDMLPSLPDGAFVTAAVVVISYLPGADDPEQRGPFLRWASDSEAGRWVHLGMAEAVANDCRAAMRRYTDDYDDGE